MIELLAMTFFALTMILPLAAYAGVLWVIYKRFGSHALSWAAAIGGILSIASFAHEATLPPEMGNGAVFAFMAKVLCASFGVLSGIVLLASLHRKKI